MANAAYIPKWKTALKESKDGKLSYYAAIPIMAEFALRIADIAQIRFVNNFKEELLERDKFASGKLFNSSDFFKMEQSGATRRFPDYLKKIEASMDYGKLPDYFHDVDRGTKSTLATIGQIKNWIRDKRKYYTKFNIKPEVGLRKEMMSFYRFDSKGIPHRISDLEAAGAISLDLMDTGIKGSKYKYVGSKRHKVKDVKEYFGVDAVYKQYKNTISEEVLKKNKKWLMDIIEKAEVDVTWQRRTATVNMTDNMLNTIWDKIGNNVVESVLNNWYIDVFEYFEFASTGIKPTVKKTISIGDMDVYKDEYTGKTIVGSEKFTKKITTGKITKPGIYQGKGAGELMRDYLMGVLRTNTDALDSEGKKTGKKTKFHPPGKKAESELKKRISVDILSNQITDEILDKMGYDKIDKGEKEIIKQVNKRLLTIINSYKKMKLAEVGLKGATMKEYNISDAIIDEWHKAFSKYSNELHKGIQDIFKGVKNATKKQYKELTLSASLSKECESLVENMVNKYAKI